MKNNILKTLSNNLGFKILALFFAFTLWLMVYNLEDPTKTKTIIVELNRLFFYWVTHQII